MMADEIPPYLIEFDRYERARLMEYIRIAKLEVYFSVDEDDSNDDIRRMIKGALWQKSTPYERL